VSRFSPNCPEFIFWAGGGKRRSGRLQQTKVLAIPVVLLISAPSSGVRDGLQLGSVGRALTTLQPLNLHSLWVGGRGRTGRSGYKSLPCRGAAGCGGRGSASGGVPASGTGSAPINALGGWGRSISRCLFRRSRSFTPGNIATTHRENCKQDYTSGDPGTGCCDGMHNALFPGHTMALAGRFSAWRSDSCQSCLEDNCYLDL
jgi:hypothetical protein